MKIVIKSKTGWSSCEDCGSYDWEEVIVEKDGEKVFEHIADAHLGGGMWHDPVAAIVEVLEALDFEVVVEEEFVND